jgi:hypothetical protein
MSAAFAVTAGPPAAILIASGDAQSDSVGSTLAPYRVRIADSRGNPVSGVTIRWVAQSGGTSAATSQTDAQGLASTVHTLGTTAGPQSVTASVSGIAGLTVTFTATAVPASVASLAFLQQPNDARIGRTIDPVRVAATDQFGNRATNFTGPMQMSIVPGTGTVGATLSGTLSVEAVSGVASFIDLRINLPGKD